MEKIKSFTVNHKLLRQGIYISWVDKVGKNKVTTFDIRTVVPNYGQPMSVQALHTIEHLGATFFRNQEEWKNKVIYFGPMGCQTGFYLILSGDYPLYKSQHKKAIKLIMNMFEFVANFDGKIPGCSAEECGNYKSHNLKEAKTIADNMIVMYKELPMLEFEYPTGDFQKDEESRVRQELFIRRPIDRNNIKDAKKRGFVIEEKKSDNLNNPIDRYERDDVSTLSPKKNVQLEINIEEDINVADSSTALF